MTSYQTESGSRSSADKHDGGNVIPTRSTAKDSYNNAPSDELRAGDDVFGVINDDGPNYRAVGWKGTSVLMMKTQIGLGVLSIPQVFDAIGLIPGVLTILAIGAMTMWTGIVVGRFKMQHTSVYGIDDVGQMLFGRIGYEVFGMAFALFCTFIAGSGMLGIATSFNAMSEHGACTAIFVAVAAIIGFSLSSIQTLGRISWLAWVGLFSIVTSILILTISVGIQDRPSAAPQVGPWIPDWHYFKYSTPADAFAALSSVVFAYAGTPAYFNIAAEMRDPRQYTKALIVCQAVMTAIYLSIGIVVYYYCGSYVASPALGSAGPLMKKVCYGIALPGLIVSTVLYVHFSAKHFFMRILRGSEHLARNTPTHWITWFSCTFGVAMIAYIIASAIPVFGGLVSLIGALLGTLMCLQPMALMWLYDHWDEGKVRKTGKWIATVAWCAFIFFGGWFLTIAGTYGSIVGIINSYNESGGSAAWTCADNSGSS